MVSRPLRMMAVRWALRATDASTSLHAEFPLTD
jgi:hypothetical protein